VVVGDCDLLFIPEEFIPEEEGKKRAGIWR